MHSKASEPCNGSDWTVCYNNLVQQVFNTTTGSLPSRVQPDYIEDLSNFTMEGVPGPGRGWLFYFRFICVLARAFALVSSLFLFHFDVFCFILFVSLVSTLLLLYVAFVCNICLYYTFVCTARCIFFGA